MLNYASKFLGSNHFFVNEIWATCCLLPSCSCRGLGGSLAPLGHMDLAERCLMYFNFLVILFGIYVLYNLKSWFVYYSFKNLPSLYTLQFLTKPNDMPIMTVGGKYCTYSNLIYLHRDHLCLTWKRTLSLISSSGHPLGISTCGALWLDPRENWHEVAILHRRQEKKIKHFCEHFLQDKISTKENKFQYKNFLIIDYKIQDLINIYNSFIIVIKFIIIS